MTTSTDHPTPSFDFVVMANRLPVDRDDSQDPPAWKTSPGGLVTGVAPVMQERTGAWVGWAGAVDAEFEPFDLDGMHLVPVPLSGKEFERYYEGFSNATLWPLYHDVIVHPEYHRTWWDAYVRVNERFARRAAEIAAPDATVWVHDYQLQLVPQMLRDLRPDLAIGFFNHIPFPAWEIFAQLPWRAQITRGMLGADLIGFQRPADAANFRRAVRIGLGRPTKDTAIAVQDESGAHSHTSHARSFPISIDATSLDELARSERIIARAAEIRRELGDPEVLLLGVDRLDYTKGIRHRIKAFGELLDDGAIKPGEATLVQIATPSRERIDQYRKIRHDVEQSVGRINGEHSTLDHQAVHYFHHSYPRDEMAAYYLAADVMLVTALRDGMNLVAKEYVACRTNDDGALVLSEFTGAAEQLTQAVMVNPYDITGLKAKILSAVRMPPAERSRRMKAMRRKLRTDDVRTWSRNFLGTLDDLADTRRSATVPALQPPVSAPERIDISPLTRAKQLLVALDFDGVVAPLQDDPTTSAPLPESAQAIRRLLALPATDVGYISGRNLAVLRDLSQAPGEALLIGSHGLETDFSALSDSSPAVFHAPLTPEEEASLAQLDEALERIRANTPEDGTGELRIERKPLGRTAHTRGVSSDRAAYFNAQLEALASQMPQLRSITGHDMVEFAARMETKGDGLNRMIEATGATAVLFMGDDTTDEDAFASLALSPLPSLAIKVGDADTAAPLRIAGPEAAAAVLARLARERAAALGSALGDLTREDSAPES
jgi:alpha,alpha-trehalose-phosphate synthase [UDP-forming]/trehalose-phosphatase